MTEEQLAKIKDIKEAKVGGSEIEAKNSIELIATLYEIEEDPIVKDVCKQKLESILSFMVNKIDWDKIDDISE